jgi:hypothetical protein
VTHRPNILTDETLSGEPCWTKKKRGKIKHAIERQREAWRRGQNRLKHEIRTKEKRGKRSSTQSETKSRMAQKEQMKAEARNGYKDVRFPRTGGST